MLQYYFQNHFIFMLHMIILVKCGISQENRLTETVPFGKQECESLLKNCTCHNSKRTVDIECKVADFFNFSGILQSRDILGVNKTLKIIFRDIKHLPARTLWGLNISELILDGQDVTVDEDVFEGISYLRIFHVRRSSIKVIPDFGNLKHSILEIEIESSHLTSLEGKHLQNLTLVRTLSFYKNSIHYIDPDVFKGTENIDRLDLSYNLLASLPPKLLDHMQKLRVITIRNNNIQRFDNLISIPHIELMYLSFNNITETDSILQFSMDSLHRLSLAGNPIKKLSEDGLLRKISKVKYLYLSHCRFQEFDAEQFSLLDHLVLLDLSYNLIEDVRKPLAHKKISVEFLHLTGNKLQSLSNMPRIRNINGMRLERNEIKYLTDEDFKPMNPMESLQLRKNQIQWIDTNTFQPSKERLMYLDLSSNLIQSLNGSVRYLSKLRKLNITYNSIQSFARDEFIGLDNLAELHLQYNRIKALGQLRHLPALVHLNINHNDIEFIRPDQIPETLTVLHLAGNPLKCDCRLQPLILWFRENKKCSTDIDLCLQSDFVNSLHEMAICPGTCSCGCTNNGEVSFMSLDCSSRNLSVLPDFLKSSFMMVEDNFTVTSPFVMNQNINPSLHLQDHVLEINLENNNLESLEAIELRPNLIQLYLANNKLRRLPEFIFDNLKNLKRVSLSGNPWECDCNAIKFKEWLTSNYAIVEDLNNTRCGKSGKGESNLYGKVMWTLSDLDICPTNDVLAILAIIGVLTFLALCLSAKILYSKYELNVKVFLYFHGITFFKEKDLDHDKRFDAFLSFSNEDGEFVAEEIIREIENKAPDVRLCIHYRDFLAGEFIRNNITYAVKNSKRTVLFLSKNFLKSEWCLMEFRAAHVQLLKDKVHRIIVIKLGDLPNEIDPQIQVYLDSTTYLTWGEKYFWRKLLYILPTSSSIRVPVSSNQGDNEMSELVHFITSHLEKIYGKA